MARSKTSKAWLNEHFKDDYVKKAQKAGLRSRAAFKLMEIQEKDKLIKPGMRVVDLGAAPGGWSQCARDWIGDSGKLIASDILPMDSIAGVDFLQGDFSDDEVFEALQALLGGAKVSVVLSDMAPNFSGVPAVDIPKSYYLAKLARDFALEWLSPGGCFLIKVFQGSGFDEYMKSLRAQFGKVVTRKPDASRPRSREVYILAKNFKS